VEQLHPIASGLRSTPGLAGQKLRVASLALTSLRSPQERLESLALDCSRLRSALCSLAGWQSVRITSRLPRPPLTRAQVLPGEPAACGTPALQVLYRTPFVLDRGLRPLRVPSRFRSLDVLRTIPHINGPLTQSAPPLKRRRVPSRCCRGRLAGGTCKHIRQRFNRSFDTMNQEPRSLKTR
jgi:hypothetical protein